MIQDQKTPTQSSDTLKNTVDKNDLVNFYNESTAIDKRVFAEMRSNVLLYAGEHYAKTDSRVWGPIRESSKLDNSTKIRIVKNHVQRICKTFMNGIVSYAPGVGVLPRNEKELQDQKAAELHNSVWEFIKDKHKMDEMVDEWAHDFVVQGELFVKVFWNNTKGRHVAYRQKTDKHGTPQWEQEPDENGQGGIPAQGDAVFTGDLDYTRLYSFNMLRDARARSIKDSPFLCYQQLLPVEDAKKYCGGDKDKEELIDGTDGAAADYISFDIGDRRYVDSKNQALILEWFFRPSVTYPKGLYIMSTRSGDKIQEMELPDGIFPIVYAGFDEMSNTPRHYSPIKVMRPYQAEINRCASKIVEHQITLGDDKVVTQMGGKMSQGATLPGIRQISVAGQNYQIIPGRTGDQYLGWLNGSIAEMYTVMGLPEEEDEKNVNLDPMMLLYRSMRQKKRFAKYASKFERFLKEICNVSLETYRFYVPDDELIPVIGRSEQVNIEEYRNSEKLLYQISLIEQGDDAESRIGKTLQMNTLMQYAGKNLTKEDLGSMMRLSPYLNKEQMFEDWTQDPDNATNDILMLDRGKYPQPRQYDNHEFHVKRLENRMSKSDYEFLHPFVQSLYQKKVEEHNAILAQNAQQLQLAASGFIPADGPLTPVDMYVQDPSSPAKTQRARVPMGALLWLIKKLESQGVEQQAMMQLSQGGQVQLTNHLKPPPPQPGAQPGQAQSGSEFGNLTQPYLSNPGGSHV